MRKIVFIITVITSLTAPSLAGAVSGVVISEFAPTADPEWVEIYNRGAVQIDLTGWSINDGNNRSDDLDLSGTIEPGSVLVMA